MDMLEKSRMEVVKKMLSSSWLYEGKPEFVDLNVDAASLELGGYVVAMKFENGTLRIAATRHPAKYINAWRHNIKRYGMPDIVTVLVSRPYLRYEAVKRRLVSVLAGYMEEEADAYRISNEEFDEKAREIFALAETASNQECAK